MSYSLDLGLTSNMTDTYTITSGSLSATPMATMLGSGASGGFLTSTGVNGTSWITATSAPESLSVKGDAKFEGEITLKGVKLSETLQRIEDRLAILHPNEALEEKWENLKGLGKAYRELEAEILEKEKIWSILKK